MKKSLLWFRNDLRIKDNKTLLQAADQAGSILPIFVWDFHLKPDVLPGLTRMGHFRQQFLSESLADLRKQLRALGSDLLVVKGRAEEIIPNLVNTLGISDVYAAHYYTDEERRIEEKLERNLFELRVTLHLYETDTLLQSDELPFPLHLLPDIFTQFRKWVEKESRVPRPLPAPTSLPPLPGPIQALDFEWKEADSPSSFHLPFSGGESKAWERIGYYFWEKNLIVQYKETRNGLLGLDYSSKLSPWLAWGCVSARSVFHEVRKFESERIANDSTYWLTFELWWREYFKFVAKKYGSRIFKPGGLRQEPGKWLHDRQRFDRWISGKTGIPFVDANIREMNQTGFMSNRGRQNVASYLAKDLGVDWTWGAAYFEHMLIDYDCSSNWGNWAYVAGVGNDPRENRYFNTWKQASMYDPQGAFIKNWLPELKDLPKDCFFSFERFRQEFANPQSLLNQVGYPKPLSSPQKA